MTGAAARLRPLIDPRRPKLRWGPHRVAPALTAADFTVPAEDVPGPVQAAWLRMVLTEATWLEPHCGSSDEPRRPKGAMDAVDAGLATLVARGKAWTSAFKAGRVPPAFVGSLSTPGTRLTEARRAAVTEDAETAARLDLGTWTAPVAEVLAGGGGHRTSASGA